MNPPDYYEPIRAAAAERWEARERDEENWRVWHGYLETVQEPRHVVAELLQNADDAGASEAEVHMADGVLTFSHNHTDFTADDFQALCRLRWSNKRTLRSIGFRGLGFKSTFSLGPVVEINTPTLAVCFERARFTLPCWTTPLDPQTTRTTVRVKVTNDGAEEVLHESLRAWVDSPLALLLFGSVGTLQVGQQTLQWTDGGQGPTARSRWKSLGGDPADSALLVNSPAMPFGPQAMRELDQVRRLDNHGPVPDCRVDLVIYGGDQRLYAVLPTQIRTSLPFACNGPFVLDPERKSIKEPLTSPTNRWLLERVRALAADTMIEWLANGQLDPVQRAAAYDLLPDKADDDRDVAGACAAIVRSACDVALTDRPILLTDDGQLVPSKSCVLLPGAALRAWPAEQAACYLAGPEAFALSRHVSPANSAKLVARGDVQEIDLDDMLAALQREAPPRPQSRPQLLRLWADLSRDVPLANQAKQLRIVPVQGAARLCAAQATVRVGRDLLSDHSWPFLEPHLTALDPEWVEYLGGAEAPDEADSDDLRLAQELLARLGLRNSSDRGQVIGAAARHLFARAGRKFEDSVRIAQIAARFDVTVSDWFLYTTRNGGERPAGSAVVWDEGDALAAYMPDDYVERHWLHGEYARALSDCSIDQWLLWHRTGKSGLANCPPITAMASLRRGDSSSFRQMLGGLGCGEQTELTFPYVQSRYASQYYRITDFDWPSAVSRHWAEIEPAQRECADRILVQRLLARPAAWREATEVRLYQSRTDGKVEGTVKAAEPVPAAWIRHLRSSACLPDTTGQYHVPSSLMMRTPQTEPLRYTDERFLREDLDTDSGRPLLAALGVRGAPRSADSLLDHLRVLSSSATVKPDDVEVVYRRLDAMASQTPGCRDRIFAALANEALVLTESGRWERSDRVFQRAEKSDLPGAEVVRLAVRGLSLWTAAGVCECPSMEHRLAWLRALVSCEQVPDTQLPALKAILRSHRVEVWEQAGHWLDLDGFWRPVADLRWRLPHGAGLGPLYAWVRCQTADLSMVGSQQCQERPFEGLARLDQAIRYDVLESDDEPSREPQPTWLRILAEHVAGWAMENGEGEMQDWAERASATFYQRVPNLRVVPYIDQRPAAAPLDREVHWSGRSLRVSASLTPAREADLVPAALGARTASDDLKRALSYAVDRPESQLRSYLAECFPWKPAVAELWLGSEPGSDTNTNTDDADPDATGDATPVPSPAGAGGAPSRGRVAPHAKVRSQVERVDRIERGRDARAVVAANWRGAGWRVIDREAERCGYDLEARQPDGQVVYIEVKGIDADSRQVTVTSDEWLWVLKHPGQCRLVVVRFEADGQFAVEELSDPFTTQPDTALVSGRFDVLLLREAGRTAMCGPAPEPA